MAPELVEYAIQAFAGLQAISVDEAYVLLGGDPDNTSVPIKYYHPICDLLQLLGYEGAWVTKIEDGESGDFMFVRGPWPIDVQGPRANLERQAWVPFGD